MGAICFAWCKDVIGKLGCKALTSECNGQDEHCSFYKTREQQDFDKEEALKRIATLPRWQRKAISDTYYRGETPWFKYVIGEENAEQEFEEMKGTAVYNGEDNAPVRTGVASGNIDNVWRKVYGDLQEVAGNA